jgi:hypothetical protein
MSLSRMLRLVAPVRTDASQELSAFFIMVTRIDELGTTLVVTSNRRTLRRNTMPLLRSLRRLLVSASVVPSSPILVLLRSVRQLLVTASVVPSLPILVILMKEALSSSETSVL